MWTLERMEQLRDLWSRGVPAREIGAKLGMSKNAVISKARRVAGCKARKEGGCLKGGKSSKSRDMKLKTGKFVFQYDGGGVRILDLKAYQCRWPVRHENGINYFCGAKSEGSYCVKHKERSVVCG